MSHIYDLIIIGSGPAGLAAAVYAQRAKLDTLVVEKAMVSGGQVLTTYEVDNYPGLPGIGGLITPQAVLFPKYAGGIYREGKHIGIVSRGLGTHTINIRLFNQPEVVSICLKRSENKK